MKINTYKAVFGAVLAAGLACAPLGATPVGAGTFSISGDIYITSTQILFGLDNNVPPTSQTAGVVPPDTGFYSGLAFPETVGIKNITSPTAANGNITIAQWLTLPGTFGFADLSNIAPNTGVATCSAANNTPGSGSCVIAPGSHVLLSEGAPDANGNPTVFASITVTGTAYTGSSSTGTSALTGVISEEIPMTNVTSLISTFESQGFFNTAYSGRFTTVPPTVVPEPGTFAALGLGMLVLGSLRKKIRSNKSE